MKINLLLCSILIIISFSVYSQDDVETNIIQLKTGEKVTGIITKTIPDSSVTVKKENGEIVTIPMEQIERIYKVPVVDVSDRYFVNRGFFISAGPGFDIALNEVANSQANGLHLGINAGYILNNHIALRLDAGYNSFPTHPREFSSGYTFTVVTLRVDILSGYLMKKSSVYLYGIAGIGLFYKIKGETVFESGGVNEGKSGIDPGLTLGLGLTFKTGKKTGIFFEARTELDLGEAVKHASYIPIKAGFVYTP